MTDPALTVAERERIAQAQARRDRAKLAAAQAEINRLESKIGALEGSLSRRAGGPARRVIRLARRLLSRLHRRPAGGPAGAGGAVEGGAARRGLALVIDHNWPQPDRDSGSLDIVTLVQALNRIGFDTILAASRQHTGDQPARDRLIAQGIHCLQPEDAGSVEEFIVRQGCTIDLCVMCRVYCGGAFLEMLQRHARQARLVFNCVDLNFLREQRKAILLDDGELLANVDKLRAHEEHVIRGSDVTFVVSEAERALLAEMLPGSLVVHMPLAREIHAPVTGFEQRAGVGFIGGFAHAPNVDAVRYFLQAIWPDVQRALPECVFSIVGAEAPADLAAGASNVRLLGHQQDVAPWFDATRVTIAPLRYGAGAKGKVASSLAHGVPCVVTGVAAEGMSLTEADGVVVCDTPAAFAQAVVQLCTDPALWCRLSLGGLAYAQRELSVHAWQARLDNILGAIGA